ncbi:MAG: hypothetical protein LC733_13455 [Actinobacteria bacterium]|nr:hypothetical protein [Actinomycetota bacterium]
MKKRVVAYVPDLLDRSKVAAAGEVTFVSRPDALAEAAAALPGIGIPVIAFANHTRRDLMDAAAAGGGAEVMARSAFFARIEELLGG